MPVIRGRQSKPYRLCPLPMWGEGMPGNVRWAGLTLRKVLCSFFRAEYTLNHKLGTMRMPHIAFLDGIVMGGGAGVSVHGQYRIATER